MTPRLFPLGAEGIPPRSGLQGKRLAARGPASPGPFTPHRSMRGPSLLGGTGQRSVPQRAQPALRPRSRIPGSNFTENGRGRAFIRKKWRRGLLRSVQDRRQFPRRSDQAGSRKKKPRLSRMAGRRSKSGLSNFEVSLILGSMFPRLNRPPPRPQAIGFTPRPMAGLRGRA